MPVFHFTNRALHGRTPFSDPELALFTWDALRKAFPNALACCLMPEHPHLVAEVDALEPAIRSFSAILGHVRRKFGRGPMWQDAPAPRLILGRDKLRRQVRYVVLNPCRRSLADDPLSWPWSTHRDLVGAAAVPWVCPSRLARALEFPPDGFARSFHRYVSADPSVDVRGTLFPAPAERSEFAVHPLGTIRDATCAAWRVTREALDHRRDVRGTFAAVARQHGWTSRPLLGRVLGVHESTVLRSERHATPRAVLAAEACLGDVRLRQLPAWEWPSRRSFSA